jgi:hypothetical protein
MESGGDKPLYLVGLPEGDLLDWAYKWQRQIADEYGVYNKEPFPPLHLTMSTLEPPGERLPQIQQIVEEVSRNIPPIPITATGFSCFGAPYLALTIYVERTRELIDAVELFKRSLAKTGLLLTNPVTDWSYHITLSSATTADQAWDEESFSKACYVKAMNPIHLTGVLSSVALWFPRFRPLAEVQRFKLDIPERPSGSSNHS